MDMDTIDRKILTILQQNARTPLKVIAEQVFLSSPAVSARIERLESAGYIQGYQAQLSCAALGYQIKAFISLEVEPSQKPEFYPYIEGCPNVMECNCVTGDYSMFIKVCFHTTQELDQFINQLHRFGRTRTQIVFSTPVEHRGIPAMDPEENELRGGLPVALANDAKTGAVAEAALNKESERDHSKGCSSSLSLMHRKCEARKV